MNDEVLRRLARAHTLLKTVRHAAMATVNEDGSPHNTPYFFMRDESLEHLYWGSSPESLHSKNVARTGQIFVVVYEANEGGGLYMRADNARVAEGKELDEALAIHNALRAKEDEDPLKREYYTGDSPQRMYVADIKQLWINLAERGKDGHIVRDYRHEIDRETILWED